MKLTFLIALAVLVFAFAVMSPALSDGSTEYKWWKSPLLDGTTYNGLPVFKGWDEVSWQNRSGVQPYQHLADDWHCTDSRPVTDTHWWG